MLLDDKGRCCGRKPIHYKGGSFASPPGSPMLFCHRCCREYDVTSGEQRPNWKYKLCPDCGRYMATAATACGECARERGEA